VHIAVVGHGEGWVIWAGFGNPFQKVFDSSRTVQQAVLRVLMQMRETPRF
jgi:hypothetical protein